MSLTKGKLALKILVGAVLMIGLLAAGGWYLEENFQQLSRQIEENRARIDNGIAEHDALESNVQQVNDQSELVKQDLSLKDEELSGVLSDAFRKNEQAIEKNLEMLEEVFSRLKELSQSIDRQGNSQEESVRLLISKTEENRREIARNRKSLDGLTSSFASLKQDSAQFGDLKTANSDLRELIQDLQNQYQRSLKELEHSVELEASRINAEIDRLSMRLEDLNRDVSRFEIRPPN